jgi:hypothetical protein
VAAVLVAMAIMDLLLPLTAVAVAVVAVKV